MDVQDILNKILTAAGSGNWKLASAFVVMALVWVVRTYGSKWWAPLGAGRWAVGVAVGTGAALSLAEAVIAGKSISLSLVMSGIVTGLVAAGIVRGTQKTMEKNVDK